MYKSIEFYSDTTGFGPYYAVVGPNEAIPAAGTDGKIRGWFPVKRDIRRSANRLCKELNAAIARAGAA